MRTEHRAIGIICAAAMIGCSPESSGRLTSPESSPERAATLSVGNTVVARVNTGINFTVPPEVFGAEVGNVLTVNGRKLADGSVNGRFNYHQTFLGETFTFVGRVTCLNIYDGNRAKVGGVIENSNDPVFGPGVFIWWQNIDNGEGANAPADQSTISGFGDEAANEAFCDSPALPRFGPHEVQNGNIQVN